MKGYLFEKTNDNSYKLTYEADVNQYRIIKMLGKRNIKKRGNGIDYEEVVIDGQHCFIKRKCLSFAVIKSFIEHSNGDRTVEYSPLENDLKDDTLLEEMGISILHYKYYYGGDDSILTLYHAIRTKDINDEIKEKLSEWSEIAIKNAAETRADRRRWIERNTIKWKKL